MFSTGKIQGLLCCPNCKGHLDIEVFSRDELGVQEGRMYCSSCEQAYSIKEGIFYLQPRSEVAASSEDWDLDSLNKLYGGAGNYRSGVEWGEYIGIPRQFMEYSEPRIKGRLYEWFEPPDGGMILDLGAGSGYFIFELMIKCGQRDVSFVGIDPAAEHVKWLESRRREEKRNNVLTVVGDGRALPFRSESFDTIVCSEVLEHIPAKRETINEMAYCLKTGGLLLLSTPSKKAVDFWNLVLGPVAWVLRTVLRTKADSLAYDSPTDPKEVNVYLTEAGFAIEKFELNVILPPAIYFAHLPRFSARLVTLVCSFLESHMKKLLAPRFAWHIVVCARKISGSG